MRLLLDTHTLLWTLIESPQLANDARGAILDPSNFVGVSPISGWELETKRAIGKLAAPTDLVEQVHLLGFTPVPITIEHGVAAGSLPLHHSDPFDRMLVAQAQLEGLTIVTRDVEIRRYDVDVLEA